MKTQDTIEYHEETPGLPLEITMDEYFKMALIQAIEGVRVGSECNMNPIVTELKRLNDNIEKFIIDSDEK